MQEGRLNGHSLLRRRPCSEGGLASKVALKEIMGVGNESAFDQ